MPLFMNFIFKNVFAMEKKYDVFISYRRKDPKGDVAGRDIARSIHLYLQKKLC